MFFLPQKTLPGLDGIRLAAILWIAVYHFGAELSVAGAYSPAFFTTGACAALVLGERPAPVELLGGVLVVGGVDVVGVTGLVR